VNPISYSEYLATLAALCQGLADLAGKATALQTMPELSADEAAGVRQALARLGLGESAKTAETGFGADAAEIIREPLSHCETIKQALSRSVLEAVYRGDRFLAGEGLKAGIVFRRDLPPRCQRLVDTDRNENRQQLCLDVRLVGEPVARALDGIPRWQRHFVCYGPGRANWGPHVERQPVHERPPRHLRFVDSDNPVTAADWVGVPLIAERTRELCERYPDNAPLPPALRLG
jgi:hypothetical protein